VNPGPEPQPLPEPNAFKLIFKVLDIAPIPEYNSMYARDAAREWLKKVEEYFHHVTLITRRDPSQAKKLAIILQKLIGQAHKHWETNQVRARYDPTLVINNLTSFGAWIMKNFREYNANDKHWDEYEWIT
jgi:hypothetical protein